MVTTAPRPKTRREIGELARRRAASRAEQAEAPQEPEVPLIWKAMEALDGFTYPTMGAQLVLAGGKYGMSREVHAAGKVTVTKIAIHLGKKGV